DRPPGLRLRQPLIESLPRTAAIARPINGRTATGRRSRPHGCPIHRKHPQRVRVARMNDYGEADIADTLRHRRADFLPAFGWAVDPEDAAMVLLIEAVRMPGRKTYAMRIMTVFGTRIRQKIRANAFVQRLPIGARVHGLEHAARRHSDVQMLRIARVDEDGVQLGAIGGTILIAAAPRLALRMLVEAIDAFPGCAAVGRAEQPLRGSTGVPRALFRCVTGCQPKCMVDDAAAAFGECGRLRRLLPSFAGVGRAKNRRAKMTCSRRREQRSWIARVADGVVNDVTVEQRAGDFPRIAREIAGERPQTFARCN